MGTWRGRGHIRRHPKDSALEISAPYSSRSLGELGTIRDDPKIARIENITINRSCILRCCEIQNLNPSLGDEHGLRCAEHTVHPSSFVVIYFLGNL